MSAYERILAKLNEMPIIDTHEHLSPFDGSFDPSEIPPKEIDTGCNSGQEFVNEDTNVVDHLLLSGYLYDLVSASGLPYEGWQRRTVEEKWQALKPVWEEVRFSGYARAALIALKDIVGYEEITDENITEVNAAFRKAMSPGLYQRVLKDKAHIEVSLLDSGQHCDPNFFRSLYRMDHFIMPVIQTHLWGIEEFTGVRIRCFNDWLKAAEVAMDRVIELGAVGIKTGLAYKRSLYFERVDYVKAEQAFNEMYKTRYIPGFEPQKIGTNRDFENYMMHYVCKLAEERGLVLQVHTGLMVGGGGNYIQHANPENLSNLCIEYPGLKFDIFHLGYPYQQSLLALAYMFKNVYVDFCWAQMISPVAAQHTLSEALEMLPHNKLLGFGGDIGGYNVMNVYGHAQLARQNIAAVLAKKVEAGIMAETEAERIGYKLLYDNAARLFNL